VSANDFECPMLSGWIQHDGGMIFTIDPRSPPCSPRGRVKVVTLGSNHITNGGYDGSGRRCATRRGRIEHTGAGLTLQDALAPAVVDVRGVRFAFVGWDDTGGSAAATAATRASRP